MCGRYSITTPLEELRRIFDFSNSSNLQPRYNVAPTQFAPVIKEQDGVKHLHMLRWGLVPRWAKSISFGSELINARCETIEQKISFKNAFRYQRCLVPADGFFEWQRRGKIKTPYRIQLEKSPVFAFAGIWEIWKNPARKDSKILSFAILTTTATPAIAHIHKRMPVIIDSCDHDVWLFGKQNEASELMQNSPPSNFEYYSVSNDVGNVANDYAGLIKPNNEKPLDLFSKNG